MKNNNPFPHKIISAISLLSLILVVTFSFLTPVKAQNTVQKNSDVNLMIQAKDTTKKALMLQKIDTEQQKTMQTGKPVLTNKYGELIEINKNTNFVLPKANNEAVEQKKDTLKK